MAFVLIFPLVNADTIFPTTTKIYINQSGQPYNKPISYTVKKYSYETGLPRNIEYNTNHVPETYKPEVVYQFSADYKKYGQEIDETYYRNYLHMDYYEIEDQTADGKNFTIKNIKNIPTFCVDASNKTRLMRDYTLNFSLDNAKWNNQNNIPTQKNFWAKIKCFFSGIFGKTLLR